MHKTFIKTIFKDLKTNLSRFIAIMAIVALGTGFLIGLLSTTPNLKSSMNNSYVKENVYDILIKSTIGFSDNTVEDLKNDYEGIREIEAYSQMDYEIEYAGEDISARLIQKNLSSDGISQVKLIAGRMPSAQNECLILDFSYFYDQNKIGETISINGNDYTVVGMCQSSLYAYKLLEPTTIGNGELDAVVFTDSKFVEDIVITDIALTLNETQHYDAFSSNYTKLVEEWVNKISDDSSKYLEAYVSELKEAAFAIIYPQIVEQYRQEIKKQLIENNVDESLHDAIIEEQLANLDAQIVTQANEEVEKQFVDLNPKWYVLDKTSNTTYVAFKENANKVNDVSVVFPFFFFFIAALIALTSITRMVSEDRSSIGTLKSLGYSNVSVLNKYLFYAIFSCVIGVLAGISFGVYLLPFIIYNCYNALFIMPDIIFNWYPLIIILSSLAMTLTILVVMIYVCYKTVKERPNSLLAPKAPRSGKKILFERITFIWKRLKFKYKSSLRNVFRFKRNLIMMIVGIGGCSALMLVALGLNYSISNSSRIQFDEIIKYNLLIETDKQLELPMLTDSSVYYFEKQTGESNLDKEYDIDLYYVDENILDYINLNNNEFNQDSCYISYQLAKDLKLKVGSNIGVVVDNEVFEFKITNIFECYVGNYILVNKTQNPNYKDNACMVKFGPNDNNNYEQIIASMYDINNVVIEDVKQTRQIYDSIAQNITAIIFVIIIFSGILAIIVIYNLTNININERIKEIATLKVIGYHQSEILGYIYREIIFMSIVGILFGFLIGPILNYFVMDKISNPGQYYLTNLVYYHYLIAFVISLVFVLLILLLFIPKIKKIKMVESLKSME